MGGGIGLGAGGKSTSTASNISKINNIETSTTKFLPTNIDKIGRVNFNISDKNETPFLQPEQNQLTGEITTKKDIIAKSNNYIILVIAILTLLFLLLKHKII